MPPEDSQRAHGDWEETASHVFALAELWALIAKHGDSVVGAWRLMRVCKAARLGVREWLETLPGMVICGGSVHGRTVRDVWRLDLATMRWERMPSLLGLRDDHVCCVVRGCIAVLGGGRYARLSSVETLLSAEEEGGGAFVNLPQLSRSGICSASAITAEESRSAAGQVLLLGGIGPDGMSSEVRLVDLATGTCMLKPNSMLHKRQRFAAGRLKDGRVVCAGGGRGQLTQMSAEVYGPPYEGASDALWTWTELPAMSVARFGCASCVMSDDRFAVLGGYCGYGPTPSCEALKLVGDDNAHWKHLPPMHEARMSFACVAVAGSIVVAGGWYSKSVEVYDEVLDRWFRLPHDLPHDGNALAYPGCALL